MGITKHHTGHNIFKYERVKDGKAIPVKGLKEEVEKACPDHQAYIDKVLCGLGMEGWAVRISPCKHRLYSSGYMASPIKLLMIESHTRSEMLTTFLHEILHYRNPWVLEEEIEERSISWFKALQVP